MSETEKLKGQVLHDTYRIERLIGEGGMGEVYEASHQRLSRRFAVKVLFPAVASNPEPMARFRREAEITSSLGHPHIVDVVDFNHMPDGRQYLVMEMLQGEDLAARIQRKKRMNVHETASILMQAASGLEAAHQHGIIHRDLKPQNIFLCHRGKRRDFVKVLDFGISKVLGSYSVMTKTHAFMGSPFYMAPEQADRRSEEVGVGTDVFSMGSIVYEMLTGQPPFIGNSIPSLLYQIVHTDSPSLRSMCPEIPASLEDVVCKAMSKRHEERYQSIELFAQEFTNAADLRAEDNDMPTEDRGRRWTDMMQQVDSDEGANQSCGLPYTAGEGRIESTLEGWGDGVPYDIQTSEWNLLGENTVSETSRVAIEKSTLSPTLDEGSIETGWDEEAIESTESSVRETAQRTTLSLSTGEVCRRRVPRSRIAILAVMASIFLTGGGLGTFFSLNYSKRDQENKSAASKIDAVKVTSSPNKIIKASIEISSTPQGATIFIDGMPTGKETPAVLDGLEGGKRYTVKLTKRGFTKHESSVTPSTMDTMRLNPTLALAKGYSMLSLASTPHGARLLVDGVDAGLKTPIERHAVRADQKYMIKLHLDKHFPWKHQFQPSEGDHFMRSVKLLQAGSLSVSSNVRAKISVGNYINGTLPLKNRILPTGTYQVRLHANRPYLNHTFTVIIGVGESVSRHVDFGFVESRRKELLIKWKKRQVDRVALVPGEYEIAFVDSKAGRSRNELIRVEPRTTKLFE